MSTKAGGSLVGVTFVALLLPGVPRSRDVGTFVRVMGGSKVPRCGRASPAGAPLRPCRSSLRSCYLAFVPGRRGRTRGTWSGPPRCFCLSAGADRETAPEPRATQHEPLCAPHHTSQGNERAFVGYSPIDVRTNNLRSAPKRRRREAAKYRW